MKSHSVKSNAKRAARKLADQNPGLTPCEPISDGSGGWWPALCAEQGAKVSQAVREATAIVGGTNDRAKYPPLARKGGDAGGDDDRDLGGYCERDAKPAVEPVPAKAPKPKASAPRNGTKREIMLDLLKRPEGASVAEICAELGWLTHTARGAISTQTRAAGLTVTTEKTDDRGRVYRAT
jgi:hypothetical protein